MYFVFFFTDTPPTVISTLSLHDALPIYRRVRRNAGNGVGRPSRGPRSGDRNSGSRSPRSEEHTSELQSRRDLVCRLLLEKKKKQLLRESIAAVDLTARAISVIFAGPRLI